jgi:hypothetical protein
MIEDVLEEIESNLFQLVGQIDYGEITNIETYWASLTESLEKLSEFGYTFESPASSLSEALAQFKRVIGDYLPNLADQMEFFCEGGGSTDSVDEEEIEKLQENAIEFEEEFLKFTQKLRDLHGKHS